MLRWITQIRTRWLIVVVAGGVLALVYAAFLAGTALDGHINIDARVHSTALCVLSVALVSGIVLTGVTHLMLRRDRAMMEEFAAVRDLISGPPAVPLAQGGTAHVGGTAWGYEQAVAEAYERGLAARPGGAKVLQMPADRR